MQNETRHTDYFIQAIEDYYARERKSLFLEFKTIQERYYANWKMMNIRSVKEKKHKKGCLVMTLRNKTMGFYPSWDILSSFHGASDENKTVGKKSEPLGKYKGKCKTTYIPATGTKMTREKGIPAARYRVEDVKPFATDWEIQMFKEYEPLICQLRVRHQEIVRARKDALKAVKEISKHHDYYPFKNDIVINDPVEDVIDIKTITLEEMQEENKLQLRDEYQHLAKSFNVEDPRDD